MLKFVTPDSHVDRMGRSHVVILGAGASRACCPQGDAAGTPLPVFADLAGCLGMQETLAEVGLPADDFESAYSQAAGEPAHEGLVHIMEKEVGAYFGALRLPDTPTIYDYLLRSLRPQDIIASFNWDPLLEQAIQRVPRALAGNLPCHAYLHGSAALNQCDACHRLFSWTDECPRCGSTSNPQPLLYPIGEKDYAATPGLKEAWKNLEIGLENAYMVTIFGYSGPATDQEAVRLFSEKWHSSPVATSGDIAFVNTCETGAIENAWADLLKNRDDGRVHWDHYENYEHTRLARYPRRSVEESWSRNFMLKLWPPAPYPSCETLEELDNHYQSLLDSEKDPTGESRVPTVIPDWPKSD